MYTVMKSIVVKYKGWFVALSVGIALSILLNNSTVRQISPTYFRYLVNRQDIAHITVVKNRLAIRERYTAEITLTSTALEKYTQKGAKFSKMGPHLFVFAGSSADEVNQWEQNLKDRNRNSFSLKKDY